MATFRVQTVVTYEVEARSAREAERIVREDTEHPIFPNGIGICVSDNVVAVEEV